MYGFAIIDIDVAYVNNRTGVFEETAPYITSIMYSTEKGMMNPFTISSFNIESRDKSYPCAVTNIKKLDKKLDFFRPRNFGIK